MADYSSYGREGTTNVADMNFHKAMFRDRRNPPRYSAIDTTQQPEDNDRGVLHDLVGLAAKYGLILGGGALILAMLYLRRPLL